MFKLEKLPKDVKEKIEDIEFLSGEEFMGFVNLKDGWVFDWDESHIASFDSRNDLIDIVRYSTIEEKM